MTHNPFRQKTGGRIDRNSRVEFEFNGKRYSGYKGDTLASALLANGVFLNARSFKYHRPRGIMGASVEEPSCLVELLGADASGNHAAATVQLRQGLKAKSVNCWPSPNFDLMSINQLFGRLLPAGFYYKTFMGQTGICLNRQSGERPVLRQHLTTKFQISILKRVIGMVMFLLWEAAQQDYWQR